MLSLNNVNGNVREGTVAVRMLQAIRIAQFREKCGTGELEGED